MRIALTGNPNSGKTTMYNALTGRNEKVGNWAGVTVDKKEHPIKKSYYSGTEQLVAKAKGLNASVALYGHTHQTVTWYDEGLYILNPGSIRSGEYGMIDITPSGIMVLQADV